MQTGKAVTSGVVLRVTDTKETDRILTVLTPDRGKIPLIARGARRKNSRLAAACQMPAYSELTIFKRGSWYMLDEASPIELFDGLGRDIELLAQHFLDSYNRQLGKQNNGISPEAMELLKTYHWPGNVRELEHTIEAALNLTDGGTVYVTDDAGHLSLIHISEPTRP